MEALQQMSLDILFCMGRVASCSTYLSSSQKSNLEMVMSESWQLVDLFIEWDWETYFTEHGQENAKYHMGKLKIFLAVLLIWSGVIKLINHSWLLKKKVSNTSNRLQIIKNYILVCLVFRICF